MSLKQFCLADVESVVVEDLRSGGCRDELILDFAAGADRQLATIGIKVAIQLWEELGRTLCKALQVLPRQWHQQQREMAVVEKERDEARKERDSLRKRNLGWEECCLSGESDLRDLLQRKTTLKCERDEALAGLSDARKAAQKWADRCKAACKERDELRAAIKACRPEIVEASAKIHGLATGHLAIAERDDAPAT